MKKINRLIILFSAVYVGLFLAAELILSRQVKETGREYLVEVNRIMRGMEEQGGFFMPDLQGMEQIVRVTFLKDADIAEMKSFFQAENGLEIHIEPLFISGELVGFVRFDCKSMIDIKSEMRIFEGMVLFAGIFTIAILLFVKIKIVKPFAALNRLPYELSKGRLDTEILENKDRFLGKFMWGISMLQDHLQESQMKSMHLEKEKKLLLLSISHDIKTPLSTIKLYAKALKEGVYDTKEKQEAAARQIEKLSGEIESHVKAIVSSSSQEIVHVEVNISEFYLKDLVEMIREYYRPKCRLAMIELIIGNFDNKLIKGSIDSTFEVVENVMENAFKYGDGKKIKISFYEEEYCQLIRISNTGLCVKQEEMPHLFDSFYRGSNVGDKTGNGLGLYICREIMQKMEGEIFAGRDDTGMSFHLVLPMIS